MIPYLAELQCAEKAARQAGELLRSRFYEERVVDERLKHDMKLRLDKECQQLIFSLLKSEFPHYACLGEEGGCGGEVEWVVDPLDGTVNYYYGLPLFCVSIALRVRGTTQLGCVYAPMTEECFCALRGAGSATLNGRPIRVSDRADMAEAIIFAGHGSHDGSGEAGIRRFAALSGQVRKMRILGTAALSLCYIAAGRLDAYIEERIYLWDVAAAGLILEVAGGIADFRPHEPQGCIGSITAWNGRLPLPETLNALQ